MKLNKNYKIFPSRYTIVDFSNELDSRWDLELIRLRILAEQSCGRKFRIG